MHRREFIQTAAATAASAGVLPALGLSVARAANVAASDSIKVGLIGCGGRGSGAAVQAMRADPGTMLTAMADVFPERIEASLTGITEELGEENKGKLDVPAANRHIGFDSYKAVLDSGCDVVLITGYPAYRPEHLKAAVAAGKHVFAEKPVAVDGPGIRSVLESAAEAKKRNLALMVGAARTPASSNKGRIGQVRAVHTTYHTSTLPKRPRQAGWSDMEFQFRNWWHHCWLSGDHIVEQAIHSVDRMAWAMNDELPLQVQCLGGRAAREGEESGDVYDHFAAIYEYANGRRTHHTCRQIDGCPGDNTDYIHGSTGRATIEGWKPIYECRDLNDVVTWKYDGPSGDMYQNEHNELFKSIREGKPINDAVRSTNSTLMAIMARMAAYTGQTITWEQAMNSQESLVPAKVSFADAAPPVVVKVPGRTKFL